MDVFFNIRTGEFVFDSDPEDLAKTDRQRWMTLNAAARERWDQLPGSPAKENAAFEGFEYTHLIVVDDFEHHVTTTLPYPATIQVLKQAAQAMLVRLKQGDGEANGPPDSDDDVSGDEDVIG